MKNLFSALFLTSLGVLGSYSASGQTPVPFLVTSTCPATANNPSILRRVNPDNSLSTIGTVNAAGTNLIVNGLGADLADPANVYAMNSVTGAGLAALLPPQFYRISLSTGAATLLGTVGTPPVQAATFPNVGLSFAINQAADGAPGSRYFLTGASLRYNVLTNTVSNVQLYLGEINLAPPTPATPVWRLVNTSQAGAAAIIETLRVSTNSYLAGNGPLPDGGFQDIAYVAATNSIVAYLGIEQQYVTVSNISSSPVATVTTPATLLPVASQVGSMYRDGLGNFYALISANGIAYRIDPVTGNYLGSSVNTGLGCTLGDATTAPGPITLPVELASFSAAPAGGQVRLDWRTASEENVARFVIERSQSGTQWDDVKTITATNQASGARYVAYDPSAPSDAFYRLRTEDRDGTTSWSEVRAVHQSGKIKLLPIFPNPAHGTFSIALSGAATGEAKLTNSLGQCVWQQPLRTAQPDADVRHLPKGVYQLVVTLADQPTARTRVVLE
jgi:Secretion system C-terminal sorting domain